MTETDAIEQVLDGLGQTAPASGIEARVLARLAAESAHSLQDHQRAGWMSRRGFAAAGVGGVLLCGVATLLVRHSTARSSAQQSAVRMSAGSQSTQSTTVVATVRTPVQQRHEAFRSRANQQGVPLQPRFEAVADSTAGLESFPAPPMPLTRQERLILRMLAGGGQAELVATLAPASKTALQSRDNAEFANFFAPAVSGDATQETVPPLPEAVPPMGANGTAPVDTMSIPAKENRKK